MQRLRSILQSKNFFLAFFLLTLGMVLITFSLPKTSKYNESEKEILGKVIDYVWNEDTLQLTVKGKEKIIVYYRCTSLEEKTSMTHLSYGDYIYAQGSITKPKENALPNTLNYQKYLENQHIFYIFYANHLEDRKKGNVLDQIKTRIIEYIREYPPYVEALVLGKKDRFAMENYQQNGISHLFAISGMHFALIIKISEYLFRKRRHKKLWISGLLIFYAYLVSFTSSVLRVLFWYHFNLWNKKNHKIWTPIQLFFIMFLIFLWINPFYLTEIGFQYSFLISFTLLLIPKKEKTLKISLLLFLVSLPISAIHFYQVNSLSIFLNLLFIPWISILYPMTLLSLFLPFLLPITNLVFQIFDQINTLASHISFTIWIIPKVSLLFWTIYFIGLFVILRNPKGKSILLLILYLFCIKTIPYWNTTAYVYFLDVGQGDSTLFISPNQKETILIDTGPNSNQVDQMITFFHSLGIERITTLVLTHGDEDHLGNAEELLKKIPITSFILNTPDHNAKEKKLIQEYPQKYQKKLQSKEFKIEEFTIPTKNDENASSLIYKITMYQFSFFMSGDIPERIEKQLLSKNITSTVLKIAHHGSNTSSSYEFLKKVHPQYSIISVGLNNRYHHPNQEVLDRLDSLQIPYLQTSKEHTITFALTKKKLLLK